MTDDRQKETVAINVILFRHDELLDSFHLLNEMDIDDSHWLDSQQHWITCTGNVLSFMDNFWLMHIITRMFKS